MEWMPSAVSSCCSVPSPAACSDAAAGCSDRATDGAGSRASMKRLGPARQLLTAATWPRTRRWTRPPSTLSPGPRNCSSPARWRASISRSRRGGGPESTKLKNPCHQPCTACCDRALSRSAGTSRPRSMYTFSSAINRASVSGWSGPVAQLEVVLDVRGHRVLHLGVAREELRPAKGRSRRSRSRCRPVSGTDCGHQLLAVRAVPVQRRRSGRRNPAQPVLTRSGLPVNSSR